MKTRCVVAAIVLLASLATPTAQQKPTAPGPPPFLAAPIPLYKVGLGTFTRKISSSNTEAQAYFDQGFQLMYSFGKFDAIRSFREAWKRDPQCAICYWGEALAWGSNLNQLIVRSGRSVRVCGRAASRRVKAKGNAAGTGVDRRAGQSIRRALRSGEARRAGQGIRPGDGDRSTRLIRTISTSARCTRMRCFSSSRARDRRRVDGRGCRTSTPRA